MSRSIFHTQCHISYQQANDIARRILQESGYHEIERNGENVWKKGTGAMTAMHFIKLDYVPGDFIISGFIQIGIGSVGLDEMDLKGFTGSVPKKSTFKTIQKVRKAILQEE
ncbi:MAG: hypothetical protein ACI4SR_01190 [Faecalibacillus sp.]